MTGRLDDSLIDPEMISCRACRSCCGSSAAAGVTRCRGFRVHDAGVGLHRQDGEHALFAYKQVLSLRVFSWALSAARSTSTGTLVRPL
tara:strand:+ start:606 stop:869 length:264 start_codon:yes stop_codon:yes gene_type:complete